jgi:hypothetical protein
VVWFALFGAVSASTFSSVTVVDIANHAAVWGGAALSVCAAIVAVRAGVGAFGFKSEWMWAVLFQVLSSLVMVTGALMEVWALTFWGQLSPEPTPVLLLAFLMTFASAALALGMWLTARATSAGFPTSAQTGPSRRN